MSNEEKGEGCLSQVLAIILMLTCGIVFGVCSYHMAKDYDDLKMRVKILEENQHEQ